MELNVGLIDRTLRVILGLLIISLGLQFNSSWGMLGLIPFLSGLVGWCPLYRMLGIRSCSRKEMKRVI